MARPSDSVPEWATGGGAAVTEPGSGKKSLGWIIGELPPAQYFNWYQRAAYRWINWLKGVFDGTEGDFRLLHARTNANESPFRVSMGPESHSSGNAWRPIISGNAGGNRHARLFSGKFDQFQGFILTLNASWNADTQLWSLEESAQNAIALVLDRGNAGIASWSKPSGSGTWGPTDWNIGPGRFGATELDSLTLNGALTTSSGTITAADLVATDDLTVGDDATIGSELVVAGLTTLEGDVTIQSPAVLYTQANASIGGELVYTSSKTRTRVFGANAFQMSAPATRDFVAGTITGNAGGATHHVLHLDAPANSIIDQVVVEYDASGGSQVICNVERRTSTPSAVANLRGAGGLNSSATGSNQTMTYLCDQNNTIVPSSASFEVRITLAANTGAVLRGVEVTYIMDRPQVF